MIRNEIAHLAVPIGDVRPYDRNPRRGVVKAIRESIRAHGQYRPIVARRGTGEVLAGNHTYRAMLAEDAAEIAVTWLDCTDDVAKRIVIVDNRTPDLATNDSRLLAELLGELDGLAGTGYTQEQLDDLLEALSPANGVEPGVGERDGLEQRQADVAFALGEFRFTVDAEEFLSWVDEVERAGGADEVKRRLDLCQS